MRKTIIFITIILMGIIVNKREEQTELQQRIAAELREKAAANSRTENDIKAPEYDVEKSEYMKNLSDSHLPGWVWLIVLVVAAAAAFFIAQLMVKK